MKIIDTHLHIWNKDELSLPWLLGEGDILNRNYSIKDYTDSVRAGEGFEVTGAIYVEVDAARDHKHKENEWILNQCKVPDNLFLGASISGYLDEEGFKEYLDSFHSSYIKGVRQVLHVPSALPGTCLGERFLENVRYLGQKGMVFEGCVRNGELPDLYQLAKACPDTTIVLNHMGIVDPDIISREQPSEEEKAYKEAWIRNIKNLASLPNVVCKISGLNPAGVWDVDTLRPAVEVALEHFGEDRIMYASNYPVCNVATGMAPWTDTLIQITESRGTGFQNKLFYENAMRVYRL
jgi:predicted TIM-barrel fold metal-dependent hydrolase